MDRIENETKHLIHERRLALSEAYNKLPDPSSYADFFEFRVPKMGKQFGHLFLIKDSSKNIYPYFYTFIKCGQSWRMTVEEYNKHIYEVTNE